KGQAIEWQQHFRMPAPDVVVNDFWTGLISAMDDDANDVGGFMVNRPKTGDADDDCGQPPSNQPCEIDGDCQNSGEQCVYNYATGTAQDWHCAAFPGAGCTCRKPPTTCQGPSCIYPDQHTIGYLQTHLRDFDAYQLPKTLAGHVTGRQRMEVT